MMKLDANKQKITNRSEAECLIALNDYTKDFDCENEQPAFDFYGVSEVTDFSAVPAGMITKELPASKYVVFSFTGKPQDSMQPVADYIYKEWFPQSTCQFSENDINTILSAGRVAPTACNQQPQRIIVVQQSENICKVQKAYNTFGSQCILIVCRDRRNELIRPFDQKCSGDLDIGIICDHIMLAARELNIGSVMVGLFDPAIIRKEFDMPEYIEPSALLILGYPENEFLSPERHSTERKPLTDTVMYEEYIEKM